MVLSMISALGLVLGGPLCSLVFTVFAQEKDRMQNTIGEEAGKM
jgi:hypothetical protein